ncbi:MAG: hypothetical protein HYX32_00125 [Actinobacteria bacterium]|nr:hypothetical protein [Actinomycetota bacterium]
MSAPRPVGPHHALRVARLLYRTHRRPPRLPWHPIATAAVGFFSTVGGAAYSTADFDAVAIVWRVTPAGVARGATRISGALAIPPVLVAATTRSWAAALAVVGVEAAALGVIATIFEVSSRRARARWLTNPRHQRPAKGDEAHLLRAGHLVGLGVGAETRHAADDMCRSIADHADLPIYLVASTPAHVRLYKRFGFERTGRSAYGETPMVRPPGPAPAEPTRPRQNTAQPSSTPPTPTRR